jgi:serine O-acetyltransferase
MFENLKNDLKASCDGKVNIIKLFSLFFASTDFRVIISYRINSWLYHHGLKYLAHYLRYRAKKNYAVEISPIARIGPGFRLVHSLGTVIGNGAIIGKNCTIYQQVTLGTSNVREGKIGYPKIGDNVVIYAGTKVLGDIKVGDRATIACNSVVIKDVPADTVVGGIPAGIIYPLK